MPEDTPCFDLNAACTGFIYALHTMECLLNAAPRKFGLVVGAEALSKVVDWTDRGTCILFGDGAAAAVVNAGRAGPPSALFWGAGEMTGCCVCRGLDGGSRTSSPWRGRRYSNLRWRPFPPVWTPR